MTLGPYVYCSTCEKLSRTPNITGDGSFNVAIYGDVKTLCFECGQRSAQVLNGEFSIDRDAAIKVLVASPETFRILDRFIGAAAQHAQGNFSDAQFKQVVEEPQTQGFLAHILKVPEGAVWAVIGMAIASGPGWINLLKDAHQEAEAKRRETPSEQRSWDEHVDGVPIPNIRPKD